MHPDEDWLAYFRHQAGRGPRPELLGALDHVRTPELRRAVDLGAGDGTETRYLLAEGWQVHAVDATPGLRERILTGQAELATDGLTTQEVRFAELSELPSASLVYAGMSLPFSSEPELQHVLALVRDALTPAGIFAAHFLGEHDDWRTRPGVTVLSRLELESALTGLDVLDHSERQFDGPSGTGPKHWHVHVVTARPATGW